MKNPQRRRKRRRRINKKKNGEKDETFEEKIDQSAEKNSQHIIYEERRFKNVQQKLKKKGKV